MSNVNRRDLLQGAVALGALGASQSFVNEAAQAATERQPDHSASKPMTPYIGAATSRVDGRAKVTGEAKYAAEFDVNGLAYGSVISSTIPKSRILRIDASEALRVEGLLDVLTHQNRRPMANQATASKPPGLFCAGTIPFLST